MHTEQRNRTRQLLQQHQIDCAIFTNPHSVTWLTGFYAPPQLGQHPFAGAPPLLWYEDGRFVLHVVDGYADAADFFAREPDGELVTHLGYTVDQPIDGLTHLLEKLRRRWQTQQHARVGIESAHLPAAILLALQESMQPSAVDSIDGWLQPLRMIKSAEELTKLAANFHLTDVGHHAARRAVAAGMREIDVWTAVHAAIEQEAGGRVPLGNDCVVNERMFNIGGWPQTHPIRQDSAVIVDLSTLLHGYWSDSCATYVAGRLSPRLTEMHAVVSEALALGASLLRPGAVAREIDQRLRQFIAAAGLPVYPHHTGHSVGVSGHEAPRLVPYSDEVLQAGMVIMLEPGSYVPGEVGVRLEDAFLITATGAERLTHHDKSLTGSAM